MRRRADILPAFFFCAARGGKRRRYRLLLANPLSDGARVSGWAFDFPLE
jgi:hypothetical protein